MKKSIVLCLSLIIGLSLYTQAFDTVKEAIGAAFAWEKTSHNFGKIPQGVPVEAIFTFTNSGDAPIVITNAKGSCGCTVPEYPTQPIAPGASAEIKAVFNAAAVGVFNKTVTITANTNKPAVLYIKGEVVANE